MKCPGCGRDVLQMHWSITYNEMRCLKCVEEQMAWENGFCSGCELLRWKIKLLEEALERTRNDVKNLRERMDYHEYRGRVDRDVEG